MSIPNYNEAARRYFKFIATQFQLGNTENDKSGLTNLKLHKADRRVVTYATSKVAPSQPELLYCVAHQRLIPLRKSIINCLLDHNCMTCAANVMDPMADLLSHFNIFETINAATPISEKLIKFLHEDFEIYDQEFQTKAIHTSTHTYENINENAHKLVATKAENRRNAYVRYAIAIFAYAISRQDALANATQKATLSDQDPLLAEWYETVMRTDASRLYTIRCNIHCNYDADFVPHRRKESYDICGRCVTTKDFKSKSNKAQLQREFISLNTKTNITKNTTGTGTIDGADMLKSATFDS